MSAPEKIPPGLTKRDVYLARDHTQPLINAFCIGGGRDGKLRSMRRGEKRTVFGDDNEFYEARTSIVNGRKKYFWVKPEISKEQFKKRAAAVFVLPGD